MKNTKNTIGKNIPLVTFVPQYNKIKKEIDTAISKVLTGGRFILGPEVEAFEKELASYIGIKFAVGLASGTDALTLAIKSLGLKGDDEVIIPANVYPVAFGVALAGIKLRLADVDPDSLNITLRTLKGVVSKKTKAIVAVHLYGNPVDLDSIKKFAKEKGIYLIEDCAQAAGSEYKGKKVGYWGDIACFSFYPTKNLGAYGDGGAILTNNKGLADKVRLWRMYGEKERYKSVLVGHNSRLDEIQAAILRVKLLHLNKWNSARRKLAERYRVEMSGLPVKVVKENPLGKGVCHLFVIRTPKRDKLVLYLSKQGIGTGIHYPVPVHLTKSFSFLGYKRGDFPVSEAASGDILSLPFYPEMSGADVDYVVSYIRKFFRK